MNIARAAEVLGVTKQTVRNLLKRGDLQGKPNGKDYDIDPVSVEALRLHRQKNADRIARKKQRKEANNDQGPEGINTGINGSDQRTGGLWGWLNKPFGRV